MKIRSGFVSNSSSSSFIITNTSMKDLTLVDFVRENPQLIEDFLERYDWYKERPEFNQENLLASAKANNEVFHAKTAKQVVFGDEDGTLIGQVFDYILRDGGESTNFAWCFHEALR